jgi:hypothetical protein
MISSVNEPTQHAPRNDRSSDSPVELCDTPPRSGAAVISTPGQKAASELYRLNMARLMACAEPSEVPSARYELELTIARGQVVGTRIKCEGPTEPSCRCIRRVLAGQAFPVPYDGTVQLPLVFGGLRPSRLPRSGHVERTREF